MSGAMAWAVVLGLASRGNHLPTRENLTDISTGLR